ncbi:hypothetical protein [Spirosoma litoris]
MTQAQLFDRTSWFFKFCECLLAVIALLNLLLIPLELLPSSFWMKYGQYFNYVLIGMVGLALVSGLVYSLLWQQREKTITLNSGLRHAWMQGIIRYWLAFSISTYGFAKILKTQLQSPSYHLDMPMGDVSGFGLTWYYFGYSYTLAVIIALFQIGGSILLLYRRTTLLGVMILLPVMVNIVLINLFYEIAVGAFFNSVIYTLSLVFFLVLDIKKLKAAFWDLVDRLPPVTLGNNWVKHGLRILPIAAAFATIESFVLTDKSDKALRGTWKVEKLIRNGQALSANAWLTDSRAWNRLYFAEGNSCAFSPNPYRYKPAESLMGDYLFDHTKNSLQVIFQMKDTLRATVSQRTDKAMKLHGIIWKDTLDMQLTRLK